MSEHAKFHGGGPKEGIELSGPADDDHAELRRRREGREGNGVKNLNGSEANLLDRKINWGNSWAEDLLTQP